MKCWISMSQITSKKRTADLTKNKSIMANLQCIPSIGPKVGEMLVEIGISKVSDLRGQNPERLYEKICAYRGELMDRCVLYHFRCAVYFATNKQHKPELLKWWSWKDE